MPWVGTDLERVMNTALVVQNIIVTEQDRPAVPFSRYGKMTS